VRLALAVLHTVLATGNWYFVIRYYALVRSYPPEIIAAAHVRRPAGLLPTACTVTVTAALLWWWAISGLDRS
jgi:hypothetical protein